MILKILTGIAVIISVFLLYVSTRNGEFRYERSGVIKAPPEKIFSYISQFRLGGLWSPYEKKDPNMKKTYVGQEGEVGSEMIFDGNSEAGSGKLTITNIVPNEKVEILLTMTKPLPAENKIEYTLTPESDGTRFTWTMSGDGGFLGKLVTLFIDCEKMVADDFLTGIENLRNLVENEK